jgi:hypothetical protein
MQKTIEGQFSVKVLPQSPQAEAAGDAIARFVLDKEYFGDDRSQARISDQTLHAWIKKRDQGKAVTATAASLSAEQLEIRQARSKTAFFISLLRSAQAAKR